MKRIFVSFLIALTAAPMMAAAAPAAAETVAGGVLDLAGVDAPAIVVKAALWQDGPPANRRNRARDNDGGGNNNNNNGNRSNWSGNNDRSDDRPRAENRNDGRINRAISIASSRGRVLDAGQQSGSVFWARVATPNGRVDLLVDTDSGRIIGER